MPTAMSATKVRSGQKAKKQSPHQWRQQQRPVQMKPPDKLLKTQYKQQLKARLRIQAQRLIQEIHSEGIS